jgi:hypothetical protein
LKDGPRNLKRRQRQGQNAVSGSDFFERRGDKWFVDRFRLSEFPVSQSQDARAGDAVSPGLAEKANRLRKRLGVPEKIYQTPRAALVVNPDYDAYFAPKAKPPKGCEPPRRTVSDPAPVIEHNQRLARRKANRLRLRSAETRQEMKDRE